MLEAGNIVFDKVPATSFVSFSMRVDQAPFDKREVRQAIAWALDRDALTQAITDVARTILGRDASQTSVDELRRTLELDVPLWQRYLRCSATSSPATGAPH
ncbi:ABC transporter substrate-binding protein [Aestuariimicrobium sp. Y1814]|uniref:ABC transporter substrate-binding protein n=1 Tax=Aestuariimicrobium sp. Y1814 TaxID=3418742 RepID=UPI003DA725E5